MSDSIPISSTICSELLAHQLELAAELNVGVNLIRRSFDYIPYSHKSLRDDIQKFLCGYPLPETR